MRTRSVAVCASGLLLAALTVACSNSSSNSNTGGSTPTTPSCTFTASAGTTSYSATGGTGTVTVTAGSGCAWTASTAASFITITAGTSGSGSGSVSFTVASNTGAARTGTLTVAGTAFTITQSGASVAPTGTLAAPTAQSPTGGTTVTTSRPTLTVNNATATGVVGPVTYRFEVSDQPTFPNDPARTFSADGVAQGSGSTTGWTLTRDLGNDVLWYWHARATNGLNLTSDYSPTETFRTPTSCTYTIAPTSLNLNSTSATATITVTTGANCSWTATTTSTFITILSGASGTGSGSVFISVPDNPGQPRTGTVTIGSQTFTVSQAGASLSASFQLFDPGTSGSATTECRIRSLSVPAVATTCSLQSNSIPLGTASIVSYAWQVQYGYGARGPFVQTGSNSSFSITEICGQTGATDDGAVVPLQVYLTVTDNAGNTATVSSGSGNQPALTLRVYNCGK